MATKRGHRAKRFLGFRGAVDIPAGDTEQERYRAGLRPSMAWELSSVLTNVAAVIVLVAALVLLANYDLHVRDRLAAVLPAGVVRYFTTETPVVDPEVIHAWESQVSGELKKAKANSKPTSNLATRSFGMGSTKKQVRAVQGAPTYMGDNLWRYGASEIYFVADRVAGWREAPENPLKLR